MSKTIRRKNAYDSKNFIEDFFEEGLCKYDYLKNNSSFKSIATRKAYYHSDRYKPFKSSLLKIVKKQSNAQSRTESRNTLNSVYLLIDYKNYEETQHEGDKNQLANMFLY